MREKPKKVIVYADGGSRGNPGPSAIGVVIEHDSGALIKSYGETIGNKTNNEAEYAAVVFALKKIKLLFGGKHTQLMRVEFRMDSDLVVSQLSGKYKVLTKHLYDPFIAVWNLKMDFGDVIFTHIPREENKRADALVNEALDGEVRQRALI